MRLYWPFNFLAISPKHCIPSLARGWRTIVCRYQLTTIKNITKTFHCRNKFFIILSLSLWNCISFCIQRSPLLYLLNVFHHNYIWKNHFRMFVYRPWKYSQPLFAGLASFCFTMRCAIRTRPHKGYMLSLGILF